MRQKRQIIEDKFGRRRVATHRELEMQENVEFFRKAAQQAAHRATAAEFMASRAYERGATDMLQREHLPLYVAEIAKHLGAALGGKLMPIAQRILNSANCRYEPRLSARAAHFDEKVTVISGRIEEMRYEIAMRP